MKLPTTLNARLLAAALLCNGVPAIAQSLYSEATYKPLTADNKAVRVGDLITIQVYENASATSSTDTSTQRSNGLNIGVSTVGAKGKQLGGSATQSASFDGGGTTQRANRLLTTLSVTVREVLPNGDLRVGGEQVLTVNDEKHRVVLEGRARPVDISADNVLLSTRLADAQINYVGDGHLSDRQKRAVWRQFLDWLGL